MVQAPLRLGPESFNWTFKEIYLFSPALTMKTKKPWNTQLLVAHPERRNQDGQCSWATRTQSLSITEQSSCLPKSVNKNMAVSGLWLAQCDFLWGSAHCPPLLSILMIERALRPSREVSLSSKNCHHHADEPGQQGHTHTPGICQRACPYNLMCPEQPFAVHIQPSPQKTHNSLTTRDKQRRAAAILP